MRDEWGMEATMFVRSLWLGFTPVSSPKNLPLLMFAHPIQFRVRHRCRLCLWLVDDAPWEKEKTKSNFKQNDSMNFLGAALEHRAVELARHHHRGRQCQRCVTMMCMLSLPVSHVSWTRTVLSPSLCYSTSKLTSSKNPWVIERLCFHSVNSLKFHTSLGALGLSSGS
jgi:hypothetical protein